MKEAFNTIQPMLHLYSPLSERSRQSEQGDGSVIKPRKLYLVPTSHGETYDPDFAPNPSPLTELPNIERWTLTYVENVS